MGSLRDSMTGKTTMKAVVEEELGEEVIASWPRGEVSAVPASTGEDSRGGTLRIPGAEIPVFDRSLGDPRERELFAALSA